jgi:hypothetical protein
LKIPEWTGNVHQTARLNVPVSDIVGYTGKSTLLGFSILLLIFTVPDPGESRKKRITPIRKMIVFSYHEGIDSSLLPDTMTRASSWRGTLTADQ